MAQFARYYIEFLRIFFGNILDFFKTQFSAIGRIFTRDIPGYFSDLKDSVALFGAGDWIILILVTLVNCALAFFVFYLFFQLLRRYVFYRSKEISKDKLMEEMAILKRENELLVNEKAEILALKTGTTLDEVNEKLRAGITSGDYDSDLESGEDGIEESSDGLAAYGRFSKLIDIDNKYKLNPANVSMAESDKLTLPEIVDKFVNFSAYELKLFYTPSMIRIFISGMATSKLMILEGISGTGKTSLPYAMGKFFNYNTNICSVQPSWRDRSELVGYLNEFTKKFNETDFLRAVYESGYREEPDFIVLDEMNLARIEYYFAEFLSIMEIPDKSEWKIDIVPATLEGDPKHIQYGKLIIPQNVWFIGTANNDDSTFTITDKVYDRAVSIELNSKADIIEGAPVGKYNCSYEYLLSLFERAKTDYAISQDSLSKLKELDVFIQAKFRIAFGNRIMKQIKLFVPTYIACGGDELEGLDFMISSKIIRKFGSLNLPYLGKELNELKALMDKKFGKGIMTHCLGMIGEFIKRV